MLWEGIISTAEDVQCCGRVLPVNRRVSSTVDGYHQYCGECSEQWKIQSVLWRMFRTVGYTIRSVEVIPLVLSSVLSLHSTEHPPQYCTDVAQSEIVKQRQLNIETSELKQLNLMSHYQQEIYS